MSDDIGKKVEAAIKSALGRFGADEEGDVVEGRRVPYARFAAQTAKVREARQALEELNREFAEYRAGVEKWQSEMKEQTAQQVSQMGLRHAEDLSLMDAGIRDPLGRQAVRAAWEAAPASERGKSVSQWWGGLVKAQAEGGDGAPTVPPTLRGYLPQAEGASAPKRPSAPPSGPTQRQAQTLDTVPLDAGMAGLLAALQQSG